MYPELKPGPGVGSRGWWFWVDAAEAVVRSEVARLVTDESADALLDLDDAALMGRAYTPVSNAWWCRGVAELVARAGNRNRTPEERQHARLCLAGRALFRHNHQTMTVPTLAELAA